MYLVYNGNCYDGNKGSRVIVMRIRTLYNWRDTQERLSTTLDIANEVN